MIPVFIFILKTFNNSVTLKYDERENVLSKKVSPGPSQIDIGSLPAVPEHREEKSKSSFAGNSANALCL